MPENLSTENNRTVLVVIKVIHTIAWATFAGCILAIPVATWQGWQQVAGWLIAIVAGEVVVLVVNKMRCPLTAVAARYTDDRRDNFDIYLPLSLARYNKHVFGTLYLAGIVFAVSRWVGG